MFDDSLQETTTFLNLEPSTKLRLDTTTAVVDRGFFSRWETGRIEV